MDELPDPTTFMLKSFRGHHVGVCPECTKEYKIEDCPNQLPTLTVFNVDPILKYTHDGKATEESVYECSVGTCDHRVIIDDEYNRRCNELVNNWFETTRGPPPRMELIVMECYIEYYNKWEPPTKPALEE